MSYKVQERLKPKGLQGISDDQIAQHWKLYEGYVTNFSQLTEQLQKAEPGSREYQELKRRAGFEFDGMALHELYFGNLTAGSKLADGSKLATHLGEKWGSLDKWRDDLRKTAMMRGIGWAILYHDPSANQLFNWWVSDHENNQPAGLNPILVLDVWEHAYMVDHGAGGRADYVSAFLANVHWEVVQDRFTRSLEGQAILRY